MTKSKAMWFLLIAVTASLLSSTRVVAQTAATTKPAPADPVVVERRPTATQVVTVLHRLNGLKMLRLLLRSGQPVGAVETMDDAFTITGQVHTNIIAGLTLDDGQTIAALLPEAEVEVETALPPFPPTTPPAVFETPWPAIAAPKGSTGGFAATLAGAPDLTIIERDGKRHSVRYIGLDGITGLSLLKLSDNRLLLPSDESDQQLLVGQLMHLLSPEPAPGAASTTSSAIYVRIGETEARVVSIDRGSSGAISRIIIKSAKLSPANIGGIAVNDSGQTVGIVNSIEGSEASVMPSAVIRGAAQRVIARQSSVPRPWLGVRGEPVAAAPLEQIVRNGWNRENAMSLFGEQRGILLTSVVPGSPAALAALRPGDVILRVNDGEVKSADDFSSLLDEAGSGKPVRFTLVRPGRLDPEAIVVKLSESLDPLFAAKMFESRNPRWAATNPLLERGIETISIRPKATTRLGASGGLLVVYVQPQTSAFQAGLRPGDVIEAINGQPIATSSTLIQDASFSLSVVRGRRKLEFTVLASSVQKPAR
jgi:S1-C subfamily serine protease